MNIGIIGGSGLYSFDEKLESIHIKTPFGDPSGPIQTTLVGSNRIYFLPRHGQGHRISPTEINYRANIYALKKLGVTCVISVSAVGSMREEIYPGHFVLPSQYIDMTQGQRPATFFGGGIVAHASLADPTCRTLCEHIWSCAKKLGITVHKGGTYVCIEGPQFSTRAESHLYRSWNIPEKVSVIGMTALPEVRLAREAGLCYQTVATATDFDCWNSDAEAVNLESVLRVLQQNVETSRQLVREVIGSNFPACASGCRGSINDSIVTQKALWPKAKQAELEIILG